MLRGQWSCLTKLDLQGSFARGSAAPLEASPKAQACCRALVSGVLSQWTELNIASNQLHYEAMEELSLGSWPLLSSLNVGGNGGCLWFCLHALSWELKAWESLQTLGVSHNSVWHPESLLHWPPSLTRLQMNNMTMRDNETEPLRLDYIIKLLALDHLAWLDLSNNMLDVGYIAVMHQGYWPHLTRLYLGGNCNTAICDLRPISWPQLTFLDLLGSVL